MLSQVSPPSDLIQESRVDSFIAIVPLYNGETSPKKLRGMLLVLYQLQIIIGYANLFATVSLCIHATLCSIFLSYVIDLGTHSIQNSASWRIPVGLQMLWGLILLSGIFFLPESPYVVFP